MVKIHTTITVDNETLQKAFAENLNISEICDIAIRSIVAEKDNPELNAINSKLKQINETRLQYENLRVETYARLIRHARMLSIIRNNPTWFLPLKTEIFDKLSINERDAWFETYARKYGYDMTIFKEEFMRMLMKVKDNGKISTNL